MYVQSSEFKCCLEHNDANLIGVIILVGKIIFILASKRGF